MVFQQTRWLFVWAKKFNDAVWEIDLLNRRMLARKQDIADLERRIDNLRTALRKERRMRDDVYEALKDLEGRHSKKSAPRDKGGRFLKKKK